MAQHPILDSIGLSGLSAHATVSEATNEVKLAVPSFATLWRAACGNGTVPKDSGIVYGTIRDAARGTPVANAVVEIMWSESCSTRPAFARTAMANRDALE